MAWPLNHLHPPVDPPQLRHLQIETSGLHSAHPCLAPLLGPHGPTSRSPMGWHQLWVPQSPQERSQELGAPPGGRQQPHSTLDHRCAEQSANISSRTTEAQQPAVSGSGSRSTHRGANDRFGKWPLQPVMLSEMSSGTPLDSYHWPKTLDTQRLTVRPGSPCHSASPTLRMPRVVTPPISKTGTPWASQSATLGLSPTQ